MFFRGFLVGFGLFRPGTARAPSYRMTFKLFIKELVLKIYILSLLIKVKIDILNYILGVYLV